MAYVVEREGSGEWREVARVESRAEAMMWLNGRPMAEMVDVEHRIRRLREGRVAITVTVVPELVRRVDELAAKRGVSRGRAVEILCGVRSD